MNGTTVTPATVVAILLADGWHRVLRGSFLVGPLGFGTGADAGTLGFRFEEADGGSLHRPATLAGPLGSILAVRQISSAASHPGEPARPAPRRWARQAREAVA
jgi:hypothetical protein